MTPTTTLDEVTHIGYRLENVSSRKLYMPTVPPTLEEETLRIFMFACMVKNAALYMMLLVL